MSMSPTMVTMTLLIDGTLQRDYGDGSCFSCGGSVLSIVDKAGKLQEACFTCGPVEYVEVENDAGAPLQGFISCAERKRCLPATLPALPDSAS